MLGDTKNTIEPSFVQKDGPTKVRPGIPVSRYPYLEKQIRKVFSSYEPITVIEPPPVDENSIRILDWKNFFNRPKRSLKPIQVEYYKNELITCCLTHVQDSYRVHLNRLKGLEILTNVVTRTRIECVSSETAVHMTWACLSCMHHFLLRLKSSTGFMQWVRRRQARRAVRVFDELLSFLLPKYYTLVLNAIITFYDEANIWTVEYFCSNMLVRILRHSLDQRAESINEILNLVENSTLTNTDISIQIIHVFYDMQESVRWKMVDEQIAERFLDLYYRSITPEKNQGYDYEPLEKALENCIRAMTIQFNEHDLMSIIKWMLKMTTLEEIREANLLNFGCLIEHVCFQYNKKMKHRPLPASVFPLILKVIASDSLFYSLLGNRVLHYLIDRCNNKLKLDTPRLFFRNSRDIITFNVFNADDKKFFQQHRETLHLTFVAAVFKHGVHKVHLESIYESIALFIVEVPCGYTAAAAVCLAMAIQETVLTTKGIEMTHAHRLHATVISIMSLVCFVHKAEVFYDYVDTIVERRASSAPHLNPPIKSVYKYAQHHLLWNKPELFFEDWEARYGLWKCFKNKKMKNAPVPNV